jgi:hypothetical protein
MWEWWDSLESVTRFYWWISYSTAVIVFLGALLGILTLWSRHQREYLTIQRQQELAKPRQLSTQQEEQFLAIVKESPKRVLVQSFTGDQEAYALASQLRGLLGNAGWEVDGDFVIPGFTEPLSGIKIELEGGAGDLERARLEVSVLKRALSAVGMPTTSTTFPSSLNTAPYKGIKLYVGSKPKPSD